ncbi:alpha-galactosidase [Negadavirga shengliensis]|uniref:Alpha-galactosidase n=1 Tax=Negadavirga shengliensis TaxID=1389218 RepID=A0ABV9T752_9BACT
MTRISYSFLILFISCSQYEHEDYQNDDWLINGTGYKAETKIIAGGKELVLTNGLVQRQFRVAPNFATVGLNNLVTGQNYLRAVRPEGRLTLNGIDYNIGGLFGQPIHNYLLEEWKDELKNDRRTFQFVDYTIDEIKPRMAWKRRPEWLSSEAAWPPKGKELSVTFTAPEFISNPSIDQGRSLPLKGIDVTVHYELYDGLPLMGKWISVKNNTENPITIDKFVGEILAVTEEESSVEGEERWELPNIHIETDFAFAAMGNREANKSVVHWKKDSLYTSQVNYLLETPALLEVHPSLGPAQTLDTGESFETFRTWELFFASYDKERKGLSMRKMYRTLSPWAMENPILMHVRNADPESVKLAIDQCAEVGFEMVIMTFGSGFNMERGDREYYRKMKELADYAHSKGIALGGYSLLASRSVSGETDIINPETGKPGRIAKYDNSPCLATEWGSEYFRKIREMYEATGLDIIEHDGSYPGDICGSHDHSGHRGLEDSQWNQYQIISDFYDWCREQGIYLNVPDWYFMNGSSKIAMGYREVNWSLPRAHQEIIERQNIYDGTWTKTPSMGWMFVPLTEYHGGGEAATIEPLNEHLDHYSRRMANLFGAGVQACYRGPRLYDTEETREVVKSWVSFYKKHREILDSDIIHLRRPDGTDWDGILHVNPDGEERGLLMLYNPLDKPISRTISTPVYYTGLAEKVKVSDSQGNSTTHWVDRHYHIRLEVSLPARGHEYFILTE